MKSREEHIAFDMNYCQQYKPKPGLMPKTYCELGHETKGMPCIGGHEKPDPCAICPDWIRRTREHAEEWADRIEESYRRMTLVGPVVAEWRKKPWGKREVIECPACKGKLHLSQASSNGHVHGQCETAGCVSWME